METEFIYCARGMENAFLSTKTGKTEVRLNVIENRYVLVIFKSFDKISSSWINDKRMKKKKVTLSYTKTLLIKMNIDDVKN